MNKILIEKDYAKKNAPVSWAVITQNNIVMYMDFISKKEAEHFRDYAYGGYYSDCKVQCIKSFKNGK